LIIIIALGESIVAIGLGASGLDLDAGVIAAALLGITVIASLWWSYFDWAIYVSQSRLTELSGPVRATYARDVYAYLHMPMVAAVCVTLIVYEVMRHRDSRAFIRAHRTDLRIDEFREVETHAVAVTAGDGTSRSWRWWRRWSRTA